MCNAVPSTGGWMATDDQLMLTKASRSGPGLWSLPDSPEELKKESHFC